jgi:hypothetical protein
MHGTVVSLSNGDVTSRLINSLAAKLRNPPSLFTEQMPIAYERYVTDTKYARGTKGNCGQQIV